MPDKNLLADWIRHATNDLIVAKHLLEDLYPKQTEIAAWHSQQCAEKTLKAFLVANDIDPPKIHDLDKLIKLCQDIDNSFSEIEIESASLSRYGVVTRYPNEWNVDETIAQTVIARAQKIYDFCVMKINLLIQDAEREIKEDEKRRNT
ncbi:MAG: HEPN domain-containing protein [Planctomycetaceae bacterium]|jgi:HEPN domain-containing protein|nr:HEPN domain-containing protein [Planctomycetaceae bacterium]